MTDDIGKMKEFLEEAQAFAYSISESAKDLKLSRGSVYMAIAYLAHTYKHGPHSGLWDRAVEIWSDVQKKMNHDAH